MANTDPIWLLFMTLDYLQRAGEAGRVAVPANELRKFVRQYVAKDEAAYKVLRTLRDAGAIGTFHQEGRLSRRHFLTKGIGEAMLAMYRKHLAEEKGHTE